MRRRVLAVVLSFLVTASPAVPAAAQSGLPVPRFVSLGTDEANLRAGPGRQYPVEWVFVRRWLPVEVVAEFDTWRRIRDRDGIEGWVHQSLLSGRRSVIVDGEAIRSLFAEPREDAAVVARVEPGVVARLDRCPDAEQPHHAWCYLRVGGHGGWMPRTALWGVYADEVVD
ncbi:MAG: SH3 domain-containing protein [Azospirillaceae bacterium]